MIKTYDNCQFKVTKDFLNVIHDDFFKLVKKQKLDQDTISKWNIWPILEESYNLDFLTVNEKRNIFIKITNSKKMNEVPKQIIEKEKTIEELSQDMINWVEAL